MQHQAVKLFYLSSKRRMEETNIITQPPIKPEIEALFNAGVHFAYKKTRRHPKMREYIAGVRSNVEVFHLERVYERLVDAMAFMEKLGTESAVILWIGTKPAACSIITDTATALQHPYVAKRWIGGTLTNFKIIRGRVEYLKTLEEAIQNPDFLKYPKHERMKTKKEVEKLQEEFGNLRLLKSIPNAMVIVDANEELTAVTEGRKVGVKTIAIMNSDCDPDAVTCPIPGNDNAVQSIKYLIGKLKEAYLKGKASAPKKDEVREKEVKDEALQNPVKNHQVPANSS
ncbi:MAG: 30S ribosomal protein S2 [Candidatus Ryanbacteria bacterium RIFCSPLOWO2_12_FULL_44_26]|nr:MAG: 30S ribosomal protein S2 [Candidatus Ryanbacteria bacterium RIFCSPLOWO2_12_FULL_44_26]